MVELVNTNKKVVVVFKCVQSLDCLWIFSEIISCVMETKGDFCHTIKLDFFLLNSTAEADYLSRDNHFALKEVEEALADNEENGAIVSITGKGLMKCESVSCLQQLTHWHDLFPIKHSAVQNCLEDVVVDLRTFGLNIDVPCSSLESIETNFPNDIDRQRSELVKRWLNSSVQLPCWWNLMQALEQTDNAVLAAELQRKHGESASLSVLLLRVEPTCMHACDVH